MYVSSPVRIFWKKSEISLPQKMLCFRLFLAGIFVAHVHGFQSAGSLGLRNSAGKHRTSAAASGPSAVFMGSTEMVASKSAGSQSTRRTVLGQAAVAILAGLAIPSKYAYADDLVSVTEAIEGSDGTISNVGFTYPKSWKYERDVRIL
jgi:hypothetical protein